MAPPFLVLRFFGSSNRFQGLQPGRELLDLLPQLVYLFSHGAKNLQVGHFCLCQSVKTFRSYQGLRTSGPVTTRKISKARRLPINGYTTAVAAKTTSRIFQEWRPRTIPLPRTNNRLSVKISYNNYSLIKTPILSDRAVRPWPCASPQMLNEIGKTMTAMSDIPYYLHCTDEFDSRQYGEAGH